jgi:hypothetical protein
VIRLKDVSDMMYNHHKEYMVSLKGMPGPEVAYRPCISVPESLQSLVIFPVAHNICILQGAQLGLNANQLV